MSNIDYKAEVLKIYDDARSYQVHNGNYGIWAYDIDRFRLLSAIHRTKDKAWFNAYENLKKEGKL